MKLSKYLWIDFTQYPVLRRLKLHLGVFFGFYEDGLVDVRNVINQYVKKDFICIDVGASIGDVTKLLSNKARKVFSFEPQPSSYLDLKDRFRNTRNVTVLNYALTTRNGIGLFYEREHGCHSSLLEDGLSQIIGFSEVPMARLDSFNLRADFIKIDTEGNELDVLVGGRELIKKCKPIIFVECWQDKEKEAAIFSFLRECGYTIIKRLSNDILAII